MSFLQIIVFVEIQIEMNQDHGVGCLIVKANDANISSDVLFFAHLLLSSSGESKFILTVTDVAQKNLSSMSYCSFLRGHIVGIFHTGPGLLYANGSKVLYGCQKGRMRSAETVTTNNITYDLICLNVSDFDTPRNSINKHITLGQQSY